MPKGKKKNVMLYLDPEVVRKAKELGLNLSKVCENALKEAIRRLEGSDLQTSSFSKRNCVVVDGAGFEPATSAMPTPRSFQADLPAQLRRYIQNYSFN